MGFAAQIASNKRLYPGYPDDPPHAVECAIGDQKRKCLADIVQLAAHPPESENKRSAAAQFRRIFGPGANAKGGPATVTPVNHKQAIFLACNRFWFSYAFIKSARAAILPVARLTFAICRPNCTRSWD